MSDAQPNERIDKWLWHARFVRTRTAATAWIKKARFRLNDRRGIKPSSLVRVDDVLVFKQGDQTRAIRVLALADRRSNADAAQLLYEEVEEE